MSKKVYALRNTKNKTGAVTLCGLSEKNHPHVSKFYTSEVNCQKCLDRMTQVQ